MKEFVAWNVFVVWNDFVAYCLSMLSLIWKDSQIIVTVLFGFWKHTVKPTKVNPLLDSMLCDSSNSAFWESCQWMWALRFLKANAKETRLLDFSFWNIFVSQDILSKESRNRNEKLMAFTIIFSERNRNEKKWMFSSLFSLRQQS